MTNIFLDFFETSVIISVIILAVALLSAIIDKKFTSKWKYWIWIIIAARLIIPFTPELNLNPGKLFITIPDKIFSAPIQVEETVDEDLSTDKAPAQSGNAVNPAPDYFEHEENIGTSGVSTSGNKIIYNYVPQPVEEEDLSTEAPAVPPAKVIEISVFDILIAIWLFGAAAMLISNIWAYRSFKRKMQTLRISAESTERRVLEYVKQRLGIDKNIEMLFCKNITSPMVMGFIHPKVILPKENYGEEELYFILCHELTHYKRHDILYKSVLLLANALHWFNPVVWLMRKLAGSDLEISCDSTVVGAGDMNLRRRYSETILAAVHRENVACSAFMTHFYGGKKTLKKRFANIFNAGVRKRGTAAFAAVILTAGFLATTVSCVAQDPKEQPTPPVEQQEPVVNPEEIEAEGTSQRPKLPAPSEETLQKVDELFAQFDSEEQIEGVPVIDTHYTKGVENIEAFISSVNKGEKASVMGFRYGSPLLYVFELSYSAQNGIRLYHFDNYFKEYDGYQITKIYDTKLFYYFTDGEYVGFTVPKYSELTEEKIEDYVAETDLPGAAITAYDAGNEVRTIHELRKDMEDQKLDWDYYNSLIPEDIFPTGMYEEGTVLYAGAAEGAAVINGEEYYKIAIHTYDDRKQSLPYDGTAYYINANDKDKIFFAEPGEGALIPVARIYASAQEHDPVTAPYSLGQYGEVTEIKAGDKLGAWTLESLEREYNDWPAQDGIKAKFTGKVELTGYIEQYPRYDKTAYMFHALTISGNDMPYYIDECFVQGIGEDNPYFIIENSEEIENFPAVAADESLLCKVTVTELNDNFGFHGHNNAKISAIESLDDSLTASAISDAFGLGPESVMGPTKLLYRGDTIGEWYLEYLNLSRDRGNNVVYVSATFTGNVTLKGSVTVSGDGEYPYTFQIAEEDLVKMPYHWDENMRGPRYEFMFDYVEKEIPELKTLKYGESIDCSVTVGTYQFGDSTNKKTESVAAITNINIDGVDYPQDSNFATFRLGKTGEDKNLRTGDRIGAWKVEKVDADPFRDSIYTEFTGDVELFGYIQRGMMSGEVDEFVVDEADLAKMPLFVADETGLSDNITAGLRLPESVKATLPDLDYDEKYYCRIKISAYEWNWAPMSLRPMMQVVSVTEEEAPGNVETNFRLGKDGEIKNLKAGSVIGAWEVRDYTYITDDGGTFTYNPNISTHFKGNAELEGYITVDEDENTWYFTPTEESSKKLPYFVKDGKTVTDFNTLFFIQYELEEQLVGLDLKYGEEYHCKINAIEYVVSFGSSQHEASIRVEAFEGI